MWSDRKLTCCGEFRLLLFELKLCTFYASPPKTELKKKKKKKKTTTTPTKTSLENISSRYLNNFLIISIRSTCSMWTNYPVTEQVEMTFNLRQRMKKFTVMCSRSLRNLNLVISRCCLAEYGESMYQNF